MTSKTRPKTELLSIGWETLRQDAQAEIGKLRERQAYLLGQKQQIDTELHQIEIDLASSSAAIRGGITAIQMLLKEQESAAAAAEAHPGEDTPEEVVKGREIRQGLELAAKREKGDRAETDNPDEPAE